MQYYYYTCTVLYMIWFIIEVQTRDLRCEFISTTRNLHVYCSSTHISSMGTKILELLYWPTCKRQSTTLS